MKDLSPKLLGALEAAEQSGVGWDELYVEVVNAYPDQYRKRLVCAMNLDREVSAFIRRTGDAIEWLLEKQATTNEPIDSRESTIVRRAAKMFGVTAIAIERAFEGIQSKQRNYVTFRRKLPVKRGV